MTLPHRPRGVQYTRPRAFKSLVDEIDFNRRWLGGGKPVYQKGSKAVRYGKFAAKMFPHVRLGLTIWELYNLGKYVYDLNSVKTPEAYVDPFLFENITHHDYVQGYNTTPISVWRTM